MNVATVAIVSVCALLIVLAEKCASHIKTSEKRAERGEA